MLVGWVGLGNVVEAVRVFDYHRVLRVSRTQLDNAKEVKERQNCVYYSTRPLLIAHVHATRLLSNITSSCVACSQKTLLNRLDSRGLDLTRRATGVNGVVYTNGESTLGSFFRKPLSLSLTEYHNIGISAMAALLCTTFEN